ncbi:metallophosphoesterase [Candidatus Woesearchaeota archaeon]|nr:metallophosphoesterase [Candidatus Woesearchaeota archaeon]
MSLKFLIIGDLHGQKPKIYFKDFDYIIAPGDFCSDKGLRPLTKKWMQVSNKKKMHFSSFLLKTIGKKKYEKLNTESLKVGRKILEYLNSFDKPVFIVPGNWDQSYRESKADKEENDFYARKYFLEAVMGNQTNQYLTKNLQNIYDCQYKLFKFGKFNIIGYGLSSNAENPKMKEDVYTKKQFILLTKKYKKLLSKLNMTYKNRNRNVPTIFLSHNVPNGTKLDILINKESEHHKKHFGSTVALDFCKKYQPLVCIGGHMHEHFGKDKIGKTTVINAGFGSYVNTLLEIEGNKIKKLRFYRGKH